MKETESKRQRFVMAYEYLRSQGVIRTQKDLAVLMKSDKTNISQALNHGKGLTESYIYRFNKAVDGIFSYEWLFNGTGEMLSNTECRITAPHGNVINGNNNSNISQTINTSSEEIEDADVIDESDTAPIIPSVWVKRQDLDIMRMAEEQWDTLEHSKVAIKDTPLDAWYLMPDNSMSPFYLKGDKIGLSLQKSKKIVPGCIYGIDTNTHGMLIRKLYEVEGGYRAHSYNSEEFPDFIIADEETMSVSRVIIQVRI